MKKRNVIVVGLLSLSLLTGCTTNKIERSQQDIKQEKVEKAKKEIASESKKKASSTNLVIPDSNESTQAESTQTETTQTESPQETYSTTPTTESHQYANCCTCDSCVAETNRLRKNIKMIRAKRIPALAITQHLSKDTQFHVHQHGGGSVIQMAIK